MGSPCAESVRPELVAGAFPHLRGVEFRHPAHAGQWLASFHDID